MSKLDPELTSMTKLGQNPSPRGKFSWKSQWSNMEDIILEHMSLYEAVNDVSKRKIRLLEGR